MYMYIVGMPVALPIWQIQFISRECPIISGTVFVCYRTISW